MPGTVIRGFELGPSNLSSAGEAVGGIARLALALAERRRQEKLEQEHQQKQLEVSAFPSILALASRVEPGQRPTTPTVRTDVVENRPVTGLLKPQAEPLAIGQGPPENEAPPPIDIGEAELAPLFSREDVPVPVERKEVNVPELLQRVMGKSISVPKLYESDIPGNVTITQEMVDKMDPLSKGYFQSQIGRVMPFKDLPEPVKPVIIPAEGTAIDPVTHEVIGTGSRRLRSRHNVLDTKTNRLARVSDEEEDEELGRYVPIPRQSGRPEDASNIMDIADAIQKGDQPAETRGLYHLIGPVRAELSRRGFNLAKANLDWEATRRWVLTANGTQQLRMRQAIDNASHALDVIDGLAEEWKGGRFPVLNKLQLQAAQSGVLGKDAASIANRLIAQITDVTSELGQVYMGGNSPTDHALQLAAKNLSADWDEKVLKDLVKLARTNLQIRSNSMRNAGVSTAPWTVPGAAPAVAPNPQSEEDKQDQDLITRLKGGRP